MLAAVVVAKQPVRRETTHEKSQRRLSRGARLFSPCNFRRQLLRRRFQRPFSSEVAISNVLVTGGAGFIGTAIAPLLTSMGHAVVAVDSLHPQVHRDGIRPTQLPDDVLLIEADITQAATWQKVLMAHRPDVVIHLAAETGTGQSLAEATRHAHVNVLGTAVMLDAFLRYKCPPQHILLASSRAVYGEGEWQTSDGLVFHPGPRKHAQLEVHEWDPVGPEGETGVALPSRAGVTAPEPTSVYGATKLAQENILKAWTAAIGTPLSILRLQNVYGPGQSLTNSYTGIVALFCRLAKSGTEIELFEDGEVTRDFIHVQDVARAIAAALAKLPARGIRCIDVGGGQSTTIAQLASILAERFSAPAPRVSGRFRDGDVRHASTDVGQMLSVLGVTPRVALRDGLEDLSRWIDKLADAEKS